MPRLYYPRMFSGGQGVTPAPIVPPTPPILTPVGGLVHSPSEIVQWLLVTTQVAGDPASATTIPWPAYASGEPDAPDDCITVYDTVGQDFGRSSVDGEQLYHYGFQIRIRATDHPMGWRKANDIRAKLTTIHLATLQIPLDGTGSKYLIYNINHIGPVIPLGKDTPQTRRSLFTVNAMLVVRQLA